MDTAARPDSRSSNRFLKMPGWKRACFGLMLASGLVAVLLCFVEMMLRSVDHGYPTTFFLEDPVSGTVMENERFVWQFYTTESSLKPHPFRFAAKKNSGTLRIFVLGESAALGTPEPAFSFSRILDRMLRHRYPEQQFEVINLAMRGINSHMIRVIAQESIAYDPDLILLYMGHNELVGWQAPGPDTKPVPSMHWIRLQQSLRSSKLGQWLRASVSSWRGLEESSQDMEFFRKHRLHPDDPRREQVLDRFQQNVDEILSAYSAADIPVLMGTVLANERDFPPMGSLHPKDWGTATATAFDDAVAKGELAQREGSQQDAIAHFQDALRLDPRYAELHYRLGRLFLQMDDMKSARLHLRAARDCDALPFRAPTACNTIVSDLARTKHSSSSIILVDLDQLVRSGSSGAATIPGMEWFYEHVHFRFQGDYWMASYFYPFVQQSLKLPTDDPELESERLLSLVEAGKQLGYNPVIEGFMIQSMIALMKQPPYLDMWNHPAMIQSQEKQFQIKYGAMGKAHLTGAIGWTLEAMKTFPKDWNLPFLAGRSAARLQDFSLAIELTSKARDLLPHSTLIRMTIAQYMMQAGQKNSARQELEHILKLNPQYRAARNALNAK